MASEAFYYSHTLAAFTKKLGTVERVENPMGRPTREHLAWMVEHMTAFDRTSLEDALRAGRWIGWMLCAAEMHGFWSNAYSRELVRIDKQHGFDTPNFNRTA